MAKQKLNPEAEAILTERFGKDTIIALATIGEGRPYVRNVNAYYENSVFYVITHGLSNKMKQIEKNLEIADKLRKAFAAWIDNGHNNFEDENTCILCINLTDGVLLSHGTCYDIDFRE